MAERKTSRNIVSVAFVGGDLDEVSSAAKVAGMKTSEFIRQSALDRIHSRAARLDVTGSGGGIRGFYEDRTSGSRVRFTSNAPAIESH